MEGVRWYLLAGARGGPNRCRILEPLRDRPRNANRLAEDLELDYTTVRHHLDLLVEPAGDGYGTVYLLADRVEYSDVLVDADGMTLYRFDPDEQGESTCYDDCAQNWPPLTVEDDPTGGADVTAELGTTERDDGSLQVTANGWPLYYFAGDEQPGDTSGQGLQDVWW